MKEGNQTDFRFQKLLPRLYAIAATQEIEIAKKLHKFVKNYPKTKSSKNSWQREQLTKRVEWSLQ